MQFDNVARDAGYYFREPSDPVPQFDGTTSKIFGVHGDEVTLEAHMRLFRGEHPLTGERLPGLANVKDRRGAYDITFNCPKPVSIAEQVGEDGRIAEVRLKAELKAMREVEDGARIRVGSGKDRLRQSGNIPWAGFGHNSSREGDPHSHRHYLVYNASWSGDMKRGFKAVELRYLDRERIDHVYHKELAKGLRSLGYDANWSRKTREFTVRGFPEEIKSEFSQRHHGIKDLEREYQEKIGKAMGGKAKGKLSLYNRPEKEEFIPIDIRRRGWASRLSKSQLTGLFGFVDKAKATVARLKVKASIQRHLGRSKATATQEIERGYGIGR